jgi:hypothetical protein
MEIRPISKNDGFISEDNSDDDYEDDSYSLLFY